MINAPRHEREYVDREVDCQEAMEPGFQAMVDCMLEARWNVRRGDAGAAAPDRRRQHEAERKRQVEADLAIARAMSRARR
jgi:hypothetical protein